MTSPQGLLGPKDPEEQRRVRAAGQFHKGLELLNLETGDRVQNLVDAIRLMSEALTAFNQEETPIDWAIMQGDIAHAYTKLPTTGPGTAACAALGSPPVKALEHFHNALQVFTETADPWRWAQLQVGLAKQYFLLRSGDREANLRQSAQCNQLALRVMTEDQHPFAWATLQVNLGRLYFLFATGDLVAHRRDAVTCFQNGLRYTSREADPQAWASLQIQQGGALMELGQRETGDHSQGAITAFENALQHFTPAANLDDWSNALTGLANIHLNRTDGDHAANLVTALRCCQDILDHTSRTNHPSTWATTHGAMALIVMERRDDAPGLALP